MKERPPLEYWLLLDVGNTTLHVGVGNARRVVWSVDVPVGNEARLKKVVSAATRDFGVKNGVLCSVAPKNKRQAMPVVRSFGLRIIELTALKNCLIEIDYPEPKTIGADRLASSIAAKSLFGAPVVSVDFGTAVTFDVVNRKGAYIGGVIAPGLAAMTDYLYERTAKLPRVQLKEPNRVIGRSTKEAMLSGAVYGYRGLVAEVLSQVTQELGRPSPRVVATGSYAHLIANSLPVICQTVPDLTLEGLRLIATRYLAGAS